MVQIPEFTAKTTPTSQTGTRPRPVPDITAAAAAPFEAAAELAGDIQKISTRFYEAQKSLQRKTEAAEKIDYLIKGDENNPGLNKLMFDAQNNPNTNTALPNFEKGFNNHRDNILSGISDPVVKQLVTSKSNELYTNNYVDVQSAVWKNIRKNAKDTLDKNLEFEFSQFLFAGGNNSKKLTAENNIKTLVQDAASDGILDVTAESYLETQMQNLYTMDAERLASDNPELFLNNLKNGSYNKKISPSDLITLEKSANSKVETLGKKYEASVKAKGVAIAKDISDLEDITNSEYFNITTWNNLYISTLENSELQKSLGLPGLDDELEKLVIIKTNFDTIQKAKASTPDQVKETLDDIKKENTRLSKDPDADPFQQKALVALEDSLSELHSKMISEMDNNLLNLAEDLDPERNIAEINLFDTDTQAFYEATRGRKEQAQEVAEFYGVPLQQLKKEEKQQVKERLENGTVEEKEILLTNLAILGGDNLKDIFVELSMEKNADIYTHVGLLMYANNGVPTDTTRSILKGIDAINSDRYKDLNKLIKDKIIVEDFAQIAIDYSPAATANNLENLTSQIQNSANMIFADKLYRNENNMIESSDKIYAAYEQSIQMAAGLTFKGKEYYGGWQNFGEGNKIILPQNMINSQPFERKGNKVKSEYPTVKEMMEEAMTPELLQKAFTYEFNVYDSAIGKTVKQKKTMLPYTEKDGVLEVQDLFETSGKSIFFDDDGKLFDNIFLETAHDGMYYIGIGDNNDGTGEYFRDETGKEILFNLKAIVPDLLLAANE